MKDKITVSISDNAANIMSAMNLNNKKKWHNLSCLAHSIHLIVMVGIY
jgi:hypothetical protein